MKRELSSEGGTGEIHLEFSAGVRTSSTDARAGHISLLLPKCNCEFQTNVKFEFTSLTFLVKSFVVCVASGELSCSFAPCLCVFVVRCECDSSVQLAILDLVHLFHFNACQPSNRRSPPGAMGVPGKKDLSLDPTGFRITKCTRVALLLLSLVSILNSPPRLSLFSAHLFSFDCCSIFVCHISGLWYQVGLDIEGILVKTRYRYKNHQLDS